MQINVRGALASSEIPPCQWHLHAGDIEEFQEYLGDYLTEHEIDSSSGNLFVYLDDFGGMPGWQISYALEFVQWACGKAPDSSDVFYIARILNNVFEEDQNIPHMIAKLKSWMDLGDSISTIDDWAWAHDYDSVTAGSTCREVVDTATEEVIPDWVLGHVNWEDMEKESYIFKYEINGETIYVHNDN